MMYVIGVVFGACCALIELIAEVFGWTYKEACVYVNLYLQYWVLMLSSISVCCVALKKMIQGFSVSRLVVLIATMLYNVPFVWLGVWLWHRYGVISAEAAFDLCLADLWALGERLDLPVDVPSYSAGWSEYYMVNLVIFIVIYLLVLFLNWGLKRCIRR